MCCIERFFAIGHKWMGYNTLGPIALAIGRVWVEGGRGFLCFFLCTIIIIFFRNGQCRWPLFLKRQKETKKRKKETKKVYLQIFQSCGSHYKKESGAASRRSNQKSRTPRHKKLFPRFALILNHKGWVVSDRNLFVAVTLSHISWRQFQRLWYSPWVPRVS